MGSNVKNHNKYGRRIAHNQDISTIKIKTESNILGALKTLLIVALILLQFAIILLSYLYLFNLFNWLVTVSFVLSLITCIYVLSTNKNGQTKATWILFLLICFLFGYIIFFLSDEHILFWHSKKQLKKIYAESDKLLKSDKDTAISNKDTELDAEYLQKCGNFPAYRNVDMKYFPSGTQLFDSVLEEMSKAKKFIFMEFFIISDGVLFERFLEIIERKVKEGVDVRIIYDDMGSHGTLKYRTKRKLKKMGVKLTSFNRFLPVVSIALNIRDHRKIIVIDGKVGYTGGANFADEYINEKRMYGYWKDSGIKLTGRSVNTFTLAFLRQWSYLTHKSINYQDYLVSDSPTTKPKKESNESITIPYVDGLDYDKPIGRDTYINMISKAKEKIYIMTPYFVPDDMIINLLKTKAQSGVDVRIILPEVADKKLVYYVTRDNVEKLLDFGVKLYTMKNSFVHSKILLTEYSAVVGSINLDQRSFYQQFESAVYTSDKGIVADVQKDFEDTFAKSQETTPATSKRRILHIRIISGLLRIISVFM